MLKAVHFWTDHGLGKFGLYYLRDKSKREVDFLVCRDDHPWILVEVKLRDGRSISPSLAYFQRQLKAPYALQVVMEMEPSNRTCFLDPKPQVVSARSFLCQPV